jgi:signal recognition particle subunit SRP54
MLGEGEDINLAATPPVPILMVGLQGSGKTTSSAKIALHLTKKRNKKVLLASLDIYRPAAQQQLKILADNNGLNVLPIIMGEKPVSIAKRAMDMGRKEGYDAVILDTAGRLHIDMELMSEVAQVRDAVNPAETLLVTDAMTGQDSVNVAKEFADKVGITGIVLTRIDGDARGGAALSMRQITGCPIKMLGTGEKIDEMEAFHPDRIANRILGMGDVVSLVEKAAETIKQEDAEKMAKKLAKGQFDLNDLLSQLKQLQKMGDLSGIMGMLPGMGALKKQMSQTKLDPKLLTHQEAIILSMTPKERENPALIKASRKKRIAAGCGLSVQDVNKLLKQYQTMSTMIKKMGKMGKKGLFGGMPKMDPSMLEGGDMPDMSKLPKGFPGAGGGLPPGFPGLGGGGLPPGFPGFGKKK